MALGALRRLRWTMVADDWGLRPLLLAVEADPRRLGRTETELARSFAGTYRVRGEATVADALRLLEGAADRAERVALVLVDDGLSEHSRRAVLDLARTRHPEARRGLLVDWGAWSDPEVARTILRGTAVGDLDSYVLRPWTEGDELFHRTIAELVQEWSRRDPRTHREVVVVADPRSGRAFEVSNLLQRNRIPYAFRDRSSTPGQRVLEAAAPAREGEVVVWMAAIGGTTLVDPSDAEVLGAWGIPTTLADAPREVDLLVVGAGPSGLAAAVYGASEGLSTLVVERDALGGQAGTSSLIRNYLGFSRGLSGSELAQRGYQQAWVFGARFVLTRSVERLERVDRGFRATVSGEGDVVARSVVLACGVAYRRLGVPSVEAFTGKGVYYGASVSAAHALAGLSAAVAGGGNSAGQAVLQLARYCREVHLVVRGERLEETMSAYLIEAVAGEPVITVHTGRDVTDASGDGRLEELVLTRRGTGEQERIGVDGLFVMIGAEPHTDWLPEEVRRDERGFVLTGMQTGRQTAHGLSGLAGHPHETSVPGIFAVGDVRAGSVKRVASAVGEGSVVVSEVHEHLATLHR